MDSQLIEKAKEEGIKSFKVVTIVYKPDGVLLLEKHPVNGQGFYELPSAQVQESESLNVSIDKAIMQETNLKTETVEKMLCYFDEEGERRFYFIAKALNPEEIDLQGKYHSFAWVQPVDAVGYPIKDELREALDLYMKQ